jgi:hypothetical protein
MNTLGAVHFGQQGNHPPHPQPINFNIIYE